MSAPGAPVGRVLVADDDADIRALVELSVRRAGHQVVASVGDGAAALAAALTHRPDLAVLDVAMPEASGLQVCRALAGQPVKVLLLSADAQDSAVRAGLDAGADGYLPKPFALRELRERITALLAPDPV